MFSLHLLQACCSHHGHRSWASMSVSPVSGSSSASVPQCRMAPCSAEQWATDQALLCGGREDWTTDSSLSSSFHSDSSVVALSVISYNVSRSDVVTHTFVLALWRLRLKTGEDVQDSLKTNHRKAKLPRGWGMFSVVEHVYPRC